LVEIGSVVSEGLPTKMAAKLKIEIKGDEI
jgi:hypothetical protein